MKKIFILIVISGCVIVTNAQSSFESVYSVLQINCGACHTPGHESGLVLNGSKEEVYDLLYDVAPTNSTASAKGFKLVTPGDPYRSFLFSKINNGLAIDVNLEDGEGTACPKDAPALNDKDIELVRQWILFGANKIGAPVDTALIAEFYDNEGIQSVPSPPAPPAEGEGYQIHYGPWFLWPGTEAEYWSKFETNIPEDIEINSLQIVMGDYSHHYIIYKYELGTYLYNPYGLRESDPEFLGVSMVTAAQYAGTLDLPAGTAFKWDADTWLDLNSHYINYSTDKALACEVYVNIYTQPNGTALYEMHTDLPANTDIYIPNDSQIHTFTDAVYAPGVSDEIFVWAMSSHTHKYGYDYDIYLRNSDGSQGEHIFDASCEGTSGVPDCPDEIYDYRHPPTRYWDNFLPIVPKDGIIHEAKYYNDGPEPVWFGLTSDDEMMVMLYFFIDDTTGLNLPATTALQDVPNTNGINNLFPNPANDIFYVQTTLPENEKILISLSDVSGKKITLNTTVENNLIIIPCSEIAPGFYYVSWFTEDKIGGSLPVMIY
ncbi:MAG TPA: T9SS type A sorting domain-containing protein [Chitinophagales bacterium]|nr:T9SS type A sorting domain-containing protein [Chitinophagales bacterium]